MPGDGMSSTFICSRSSRTAWATWMREVTTVSSPDDFSALVDAVRAGYAEARDWTYVRADGKHVPVQVTATPRLDEIGHRIGFIFVATDMTKAREFARLKDEFVGLISHELRTPLSSILGYLELMRDDEESPLSAEQLQYLGVAERNAHRLLRLVGDLLFTAQVESGHFPLDLRELDLNDVVAGVDRVGTSGGRDRGDRPRRAAGPRRRAHDR